MTRSGHRLRRAIPLVLALLLMLALAGHRPGGPAGRRPGHGRQLRRPGRVDGHQHRAERDQRRPGPEPRLLDHRLPARNRERHGARHRRRRLPGAIRPDPASNNAAGRLPPAVVPGDLGGLFLTSGVFKRSSSLLLTGDVTLDAQGDPNAVFIFQIGSTLTTASNSRVLLTGGAQACNVFWQIGSSATLGTGTSFNGNVLALTSITVNTAATVRGGCWHATARSRWTPTPSPGRLRGRHHPGRGPRPPAAGPPAEGPPAARPRAPALCRTGRRSSRPGRAGW